MLYGAVVAARNRLYDKGLKPSVSFDAAVIGVGNLSAGGTGKTPMIEYLIRLLGSEYKIATLSRGYGRRSKGFRIAGDKDDALTLGDEPFQFYTKFHEKVVVAVGEERAMAIPLILDQYPDTNIILLDDAFQHRSVRPSFQVLLTDYHRLFVHDFLLPAGRLRESRSGADRADCTIVSKCPPHISDDEMISIESAIRKYTDKPVFFTGISYRGILPASGKSPYKPEKVVIVSGIANPKPLEDYITANFALVRHFAFRDHHIFSTDEVQKICDTAAHSGSAVVTTEKDLARLDPAPFEKASVPLYYLPIETEFIKSGKEFDAMVLNAVMSDAV
jgi:tetraacyldisaccharide 4'-kinase